MCGYFYLLLLILCPVTASPQSSRLHLQYLQPVVLPLLQLKMNEQSNSGSPQAGWKSYDVSCYMYVGMCMCTCMSLCMFREYMHVSRGVYRSQKCQDSLEMELEEVVSPLAWVVLRAELQSSTKSILLTTEPYVSPALWCLLLLIQRQKPWATNCMK